MEWELDPELNSEEYLRRGVNLPIPRNKYYYDTYWRPNRWSSRVCELTGYTQFNVHDTQTWIDEFGNELWMGGNSVETIFKLLTNKHFLGNFLKKIKYVILEIPYIRWHDEKIHGGVDGYKYPNTILEILDVLNNPKTHQTVIAKTLQWLHDIDIDTYDFKFWDGLRKLKYDYPEIKFLVLPWNINKADLQEGDIIDIVENGIDYGCVNNFLSKNKLFVSDKAKAWNGNYIYNMRDDHASVEGHKRIANIVYNYIKKIENGNQ